MAEGLRRTVRVLRSPPCVHGSLACSGPQPPCGLRSALPRPRPRAAPSGGAVSPRPTRAQPPAAAVWIALLVAASAAAQPVESRVSFPAPEHHYAQVEVTWTAVPAGVLEARMSRSSPGRYAIHAFSKNV